MAARRRSEVAWLPSSTSPHWARRKTPVAAAARVPSPATAARAATHASCRHTAEPGHSPGGWGGIVWYGVVFMKMRTGLKKK